jgi:predicted acylesterase/phospholipase RssA
MKKIGLALSGGGFRASLYHLGLLRFLRDAGLLSNVTDISSVSGGSILAAHLLLNWERYNGSANDFDAAANEFLAFIRLDVRNRILRRFPLASALYWPRRWLGCSNRKLSRTGMLEHHYEKFLYGDVSLFELPEKPHLHMLSTNLSEGCLCSFNRNGLLMMRRNQGNGYRIEHIHIGLATVAMAVAASSAFPGFFPPLELTGNDVGANTGEFGRQSYTDGAVFDNLGVRIFGYLKRNLLADTPLTRDDFVDFPATMDTLRQAAISSKESPLRRVAQIMVTNRGGPPALEDLGTSSSAPLPADRVNNVSEELIVSRLWNLMRHYPLHREPFFENLKLVDADAEALLHSSCLSDRVLDSADQTWLNRHLLEAAFREANGGRPCFRRLRSGLDAVLVSDVGKPFEVKSNVPAGGLIRTAMRSTDILMDRVWQLETDIFHDSPGFVFACVTDVVEPTEDPTVVHPEIQRHAATIRTDLDRFSTLEISSLVRHGYCVARKVCRAHPNLFGTDLPANPPWDPVAGQRGAAAVPTATTGPNLLALERRPAAPATAEARELQSSALRRIWSTMLDYRDWISYVYVPIIVPILVLLPYFVVKSYERSHRLSQLIDSLSQGSRDLDVMTRLLDAPIKPFVGVPAEEERRLEDPNFTGFEVLQDSRILDLRSWNPEENADPNSGVYGYRRIKVMRRRDNVVRTAFTVDVLTTHPNSQIRFPEQRLQPKLHMTKLDLPGEKRTRFQATWDFEKVPPGEYVDLIYEHYSPAVFMRRGPNSTSVAIHMQADTAEVTRWFLMPRGREYKNFRVIRYENGKPQRAEPVKLVTEYLADDYSILAYKLMMTEAGYTYEVSWTYR